jgi:acetyl-CoA carboxylase biotin carboxyl carrier protein
MNIEEIRQLAEIMCTYGLERFELEEGTTQMRLWRPAVYSCPAPAEPAVPAPGARESAGQVPSAPAPAAGRVIVSPMVGVFYSAPTPGADPFIAVGKRLAEGEVLCIVEAMKMMNEITAEFAGEVAAIHAADGDIVEVGQPLLTLI